MPKIKNIIIVSLYNTKGGPLVLNYLAHLLNQAGFNTRIYLCKYPVTSKKYSVIKFFINHVDVTIRYLLCNKFPLLKKLFPNKFFDLKYFSKAKLKILPYFNKNTTIVIYPEIFYGNPMKAKNVVRWLLYYNRYSDDINAYSKDDLFIAYRKIFNDRILNPCELIVQINFFDSNLYKKYNFGKREGVCYILRKGRSRNDLPTHFDGPVFDNNMSEEEFVKVLNACKYCFSYDTQTFYTAIAAVCGCIPIIVMEKGKQKSDYLSNGENAYGVAYGHSPKEIEIAIQTRPLLLKSLDFEESNQKNLKVFINILEDRFGNFINDK